MSKQERTGAIVTGGGTGIGKAISLALAKRGLAVAVVYSRSKDDAESVVAEIERGGGVALAIAADVAKDGAVKEMVARVVEEFGTLKYLVNNAGITRQLKFDDLDAIDDSAWDDLYATNVKGAFHCVRAAAPYLRKTPGAAVVNVGSIAGETGFGSSIPYATSKAALHGLTRSLARALAPAIRVNCVAPGAVATRWWAGNEEKMRALSTNLPLQRILSPEDIADVALTLLEAASMTGQIVRADSGQTL